ncbi:hypothetical protein EDB85DRAFT_1410363 [Lactarius pseudohatsudake]|nr:hypothetical protein EDB85DRAFT_1410363 [Lactarius pseudohatsudake]
MSTQTQILVYVPLLSKLCAYPHTTSYVGELRTAIWTEESARLSDHGGRFHQISLRSLFPWNQRIPSEKGWWTAHVEKGGRISRMEKKCLLVGVTRRMSMCTFMSI